MQFRYGWHSDTYSRFLLETIQMRSRYGWHSDTYSRFSSRNNSDAIQIWLTFWYLLQIPSRNSSDAWWKMTLGTWFWPKKSKFDFLVYSQILISWLENSSVNPVHLGLLNFLNGSRQFNWVLDSMCELDLPLARSNSQKLPLYSQNPKNDHFALLVIWSNFLWNYDPNLIKWFIWVHNVDVNQISWGLTVNWPQLTFPQYSWFFRSTVQLTGQRSESRLETWYGQTCEPNMRHESQIGYCRSKYPCANSNPSLGQQCKEGSWAEQTLAWSWIPRVLWWESVDEMRGKILGYNSFARRRTENRNLRYKKP